MRTPTLRRLLLIATTAAALAAPAGASANSYWVSLDVNRGEIQQGVNGFSWHTHGGPFNTYGSHCEALPGTYVAGAYCILRFNVPAGLTAGAVGNGGITRGQYRTANPNFFLRREKPGANPATVVDTDGDGDWAHGWGALGSYVDNGLRTSAATTTSATSNWFHANTFDIVLHDPSAPVIRSVAVGGGPWKGPGCTPISYAWSDDGSQLWAASLSNLSTGAGVHSWSANPGLTVVQSGVPSATFTSCLPAQPTGTYTYRTSATDRSGNTSNHDFIVSFDTTVPSVSAMSFAGAPIADGASIATTYRPTFSWTIGDAHSGIASVQIRVDDTPVPSHLSGGTVTSDLVADLALGEHTISATATDAAGNSNTQSQRVRIVDATKPQISFAMPARTGGNNPILDVSATDDRSGIATNTWTVLVNGEPLAVASSTDRLLAELGYLVDGSHDIEVRVSDKAGNTASSRLSYVARGGSAASELPGIDGLYVLEAPAEFEQGTMTRIRAAAVRRGRPLAGLRAELHQGDVTIAGKPIAQDGTVDIAVTVNSAGPLVLTVNGSGLANQTIDFRFIAKPVASATVAGGGGSTNKPRVPTAVVARAINGDTIRLRDGRTVRLLQVDAPETNECHGGRSTAMLRRILRPGTRISLQAERRLGTVDAHRQLLRYVVVGRTNVNRLLVQRGAATPHFVGGKRGRLARALLTDARKARSADRGLWKACPGTKLTPSRGANTGPT